MAHLDRFDLHSRCTNWGCLVVALHLLRGMSPQPDGCRLMGRTCQACGRQWQENLGVCADGRHMARQ